MNDIMQALTANTHPTHRWMPEDDVLCCDYCGVRTYHRDARLPCPSHISERYDLVRIIAMLHARWREQGHNPMFVSVSDDNSTHGCSLCLVMVILTWRYEWSLSSQALDTTCDKEGTA